MSNAVFAVQSRRDIFEAMVSDIRNTAADVAVESEGDDMRDIAFAASGTLADANEALKRAVDESFDDTASLASLKKRNAHKVGDPDVGTVAYIDVVITGTVGSAWTTGDILIAPETGGRYSPTAPGAMPGAETATIELTALTVGDDGALADGVQLMWEAPPAGLGAIATTTGDPSGGTDPEDPDEYRARVFGFYANPSGDWSLAGVERFALALTGVGQAKAVRARRALGTFDVAVLDHEGDALGVAAFAAANAEFQAALPAGCKGSTLVTPTFVDVTVQRRMVMASGYGFSSFAAKTTNGDSTTSAIHTNDATTDVTAGDWVAVKVVVRGRSYWLAREVYQVETGVIYLATTLPAAPATGVAIRPGCPTFDALAAALQSYFQTIRSGQPFYNEAANRFLFENPEVQNVQIVQPAADVDAVVSAFAWQRLRLGDFIVGPA